MSWFRKGPKPPEGDDWITVPFRFAEAARVSIYTIGSRPEIPEQLRWWIATWLANYNAHLVHYMQDRYGSEIFDHLDRITMDVMPDVERPAPDAGAETWNRWEEQLKGDDGE